MTGPIIADTPALMRTTGWADYALVDSGGGRKLERYGPYHVVRPEPQCLWTPRLPAARLLLKAPSFKDAGAVQSFVQRFAAHGIGAQRLEFRGPVGLSDMMAEYADVDIALDPVPYNGGTTSLQAMWMGVPVVTQMGAHFVSRMGASFMTAAGLPEWVAKDDDDYVAIAKKMGSDRKALLSLKKGLRKRLQAKQGWDIKAHTRAIEHALLTSF